MPCFHNNRDAEERQVLIHDADAESLFPNLDYWKAKAEGKVLDDGAGAQPRGGPPHKPRPGGKFPAMSNRR